MSDQITTTSRKGWGSRILDSIKGIFFGFILFLVSFGVLYWNEGRVDVSEIAETAVEIESTVQAPSETRDQLVSTTGILQSEEPLGDTFLKEGAYLAIQRTAEMYAWIEEEHTETVSDTGGSETTETTYSYKRDWTQNPANSKSFQQPQGHENPPITVESHSVRVRKAKIGIYDLEMGKIALPSYSSLSLNAENVLLADGFQLGNNEYLFKGQGSPNNPVIGDMRIGYSVLPNPLERTTAFGKLEKNDDIITPFYGEKNTELYRVFEGSRDSAISTMKTEHAVMTWILRLVGFLLMWGGLSMMLRPIVVVLDVLPFLGKLGGAGIGIVTFIIALILSIVTILLSMLLHNIYALIIGVLVCIAGMVWYVKNKQKPKTP